MTEATTPETKTETAWRVFKYDDERTDNTWHEVGYVEPRYSYGGPDVQTLGEQFGAGRFLCIGPSAFPIVEKIIVARSTYEEQTDESDVD